MPRLRFACLRLGLAAGAVVLCTSLAGCGGAASTPASTPATSQPAAASAGDSGSLAAQNGVADKSSMAGMPGMNMPMMPHSDHKPRHGGIVLMNGDLHFEVVMKRSGNYEVYFSNAMRDPLPASLASDVTITVEQQGFPPEPLTLQIDDSGDYWVGHGRPVTDPNASARIAYVIGDKPYWIDMPYVEPVGGSLPKKKGNQP